MKRLLFFLVFLTYGCLIVGMETSGEQVGSYRDERKRIHKKYQRKRYLPVYVNKVRENLAELDIRVTNPREMTAFFNVIIAFMEAIDTISCDATEEAGQENDFCKSKMDDSLYISAAIENIYKAFESGFDYEIIEDGIDEVATVAFDVIAKNLLVKVLIQQKIEKDRDPTAYISEGTRPGYSWNNAFAIAEYEALNWNILHFKDLLPVANEYALKYLPEDLGKNVFYKPNTAFNFLNGVKNFHFLTSFDEDTKLWAAYYSFPWIKKLQSDINACCYFFLAMKDKNSTIFMLKPASEHLAQFLAELYLPSGKKYVHYEPDPQLSSSIEAPLSGKKVVPAAPNPAILVPNEAPLSGKQVAPAAPNSPTLVLIEAPAGEIEKVTKKKKIKKPCNIQ